MAIRLCAALLAAIVLSGCASKVPEAIREPLPDTPEPGEVRKDPAAYIGERVRWGGTITRVHNLEASTRLEVVARPLAGEGRPRTDASAAGRFLAAVEGFLDPAVYGEGRKVTVTGTLAEAESGSIGDYRYRYPVVKVTEHYLWPRERPARSPPPPSWYYDPWYPYYGPRHPYW